MALGGMSAGHSRQWLGVSASGGPSPLKQASVLSRSQRRGEELIAWHLGVDAPILQ